MHHCVLLCCPLCSPRERGAVRPLADSLRTTSNSSPSAGHLFYGPPLCPSTHLRQLREGVPVSTCRVRYCLADTRAAPLIAQCSAAGVRVLATGTLVGGLIAERWLGAACPAAIPPGANDSGGAGGLALHATSLEALDIVAG